jgi:hypothetical protein
MHRSRLPQTIYTGWHLGAQLRNAINKLPNWNIHSRQVHRGDKPQSLVLRFSMLMAPLRPVNKMELTGELRAAAVESAALLMSSSMFAEPLRLLLGVVLRAFAGVEPPCRGRGAWTRFGEGEATRRRGARCQHIAGAWAADLATSTPRARCSTVTRAARTRAAAWAPCWSQRYDPRMRVASEAHRWCSSSSAVSLHAGRIQRRPPSLSPQPPRPPPDTMACRFLVGPRGLLIDGSGAGRETDGVRPPFAATECHI